MSFAVSSITKPKTNYVDDMVSNLESKRPRSYSTESEAAASDGESGATEDARVDALERIEICVSRLGGAPAHPDWLDTSCSLRHGISMDEAQSLALRTLDVLSRVVGRAKIELHKCGVTAFEVCSESGSSPSFPGLVLKMLESVRLGSADVNEVARMCNVEPQVVQYVADSSACVSRMSALSTWCSNSAQRVLGHLNVLFRNQMIDISELGLGELRVGEEWEVGLSFALTSACAGSAGIERKDGFTDSVCDSVVGFSRWERLATTALSCLVPVSALVRYTTYRKGRNPHPFSKIDACTEDYQFVKTYLLEQMPSCSTVNPSLTSIVQRAVQTLTLPTFPPVYNDQTAELIAANLFIDPLAFLVLRSAASVKSALGTLAGIVEACNVADSDFQVAVQRLAMFLVKRDHNDTERTSGIVKVFLSRKDEPVQGSVVLGGGEPQFHACDHHRYDLASTIIALLWGCPSLAEHDSRQLIILELGNLAAMEMRDHGKNVMNVHLFNWLTSLSPDRLMEVLDTDVVGASDQVATSVCAVLAAALLSNRRDYEGGYENSLFGLLMGVVCDGNWIEARSRTRSTKFSAILNLLFLYGTFCAKLGSIIVFFMENVTENLLSIEAFVAFLRDLHLCLEADNVGIILTERESDAFDSVPASCSFALKEGFYEQHWYNCKTCGLIDEKGCCSVRLRKLLLFMFKSTCEVSDMLPLSFVRLCVIGDTMYLMQDLVRFSVIVGLRMETKASAHFADACLL